MGTVINTCDRCGGSYTTRRESSKFCARPLCQRARKNGALPKVLCACKSGKRVAVEYLVRTGTGWVTNSKHLFDPIRVCLDCLVLAYQVEGELNISKRWCPECGLSLLNGATWCREHERDYSEYDSNNSR